MKKLTENNISWLIALAFATIILACVPSLLNANDEEESVFIPSVEQRVTLLDDSRQIILESRWIQDNEEDLVKGKLKVEDNPYLETKTIYQLKTSLGEDYTNFVYGTQTEIERQKCIEYNKGIDIRKELEKLYKPCK